MSPLPPRRAHDIGFSDAVSDVVDIVKHETSRRGRARGCQSKFIRLLLIFILQMTFFFHLDCVSLQRNCVVTSTVCLVVERPHAKIGTFVLE